MEYSRVRVKLLLSPGRYDVVTSLRGYKVVLLGRYRASLANSL